MKRFLLILSACFFFNSLTYANHITGGEMYYTFLGQSGGSYQYRVTLKLFRDCNSTGAPLDPAAAVGIFERTTGNMIWNQSITMTQMVTLNLGSPNPCITNPPIVCYQVGYYTFDINVPANAGGYIVAYQRCCRIAGINNLAGSSNVGTTYTAEIPGTSPLATAPENNSAKFVGADTVIVCAGYGFTYSFAAVDDDGDELSYSFCDAFTGGSPGNAAPNPPAPPPYGIVPYAFPFNGSSPLGGGVTIDGNTGLI